jgi:hypothetical protein
MTTPREPLTPEEHALAQRLARAPGPREPGPALDARILAAARAAVSGEPSEAEPPAGALPPGNAHPDPAPSVPHPRRPSRRHWTLGFGVAASLMLVVTLAWQLRPQRSTQLVYEAAEAPASPQPVADLPSPASAPSRVASQAADTAAPGSTASDPGPVTLDPPAALSRSAPPPAPMARPVPVELPPPPAQVAPPPPEAPMVQRQEMAPKQASAPAAMLKAAPAVDTYTPPAPPSPPAPSLPAPTPDMGTDADAANRHQAPADLAQASQAATSAARNREGRALRLAAPAPPAALAEPPAADASIDGLDAAGQATLAEDSRLPPDRWLQRIRRHRFEGNSALARASLQAFRRDHPQQVIPEDLRALLP